MICVLLAGNRYTIKEQFRVSRLFFLDGKNDLDGLFSYIRIKDHFPQVGPIGNSLKILDKFFVGFINLFNTSEKRRIVHE